MNNIEEMFQDMHNATSDIKELFEKILETKIKEVKYEGKEYFKNINEYDFSLIKLCLLCENDEKIQLYVKNIRGGKIKESIFCFWSLIYENYIIKSKSKDTYENKKVIIKQKSVDESDTNIFLTFDQSLDYCAEINLIKLEKFATKYKELERWLNKLQIKSEDILFVGRNLISNK